MKLTAITKKQAAPKAKKCCPQPMAKKVVTPQVPMAKKALASDTFVKTNKK